jgi:hypothetical protein
MALPMPIPLGRIGLIVAATPAAGFGPRRCALGQRADVPTAQREEP